MQAAAFRSCMPLYSVWKGYHMKITPCSSSVRTVFFFTVAIAAGFLNGFIGTGGGILIIFILRWFYRFHPDLYHPKDFFAAAILCILPISFISLLIYAPHQKIDFLSFLPTLVCGAAGSLLGAWLLDKIKLPFLNRLFALLIIWAGVSMLRT